MEKWVVYNKRADFKAIGQQLHIDQVTARVIRNRDVIGEEETRLFLSGGKKDLYDPSLLKDADLLTDILADKIRSKRTIRIIGDYDIDGVMATYILMKALSDHGARVSFQIPDRIIDGYGLNSNLIKKAQEDGIDTILTCDNGIAALDEIALAVELGMTVLVTDHHEIPFEEINGERTEKKSKAAAVVNPHQKDCRYPNKNLCGAAVAWKVVQLLYEKLGEQREKADEFLENVAFATVGDIMSLIGENRILVKEGLRAIHHTDNIGMNALIHRCNLDPGAVTAYHFGFVLGPCINASGRLDTAARVLELFLCKDAARAAVIAEELTVLNEQRKLMTAEGVEQAKLICEQEEYRKDSVLVIYLPKVHESVAGIIAGRIREEYHKPVFVLTNGAHGVKGSGRSIEAYSMYDELCKCERYLTKFGGHPMAAGISLAAEDVEAFRKALNACCSLREEDFVEKVRIDVPMPVDYVTLNLVEEFQCLAPFGKDNPHPLFADRNLRIRRMAMLGKTRKILKLTVLSSGGTSIDVIYFGAPEKFIDFLTAKFGARQVELAMEGRNNEITFSMAYEPDINEFRGRVSLQFVMKYFC